jgi:hypothetical protein
MCDDAPMPPGLCFRLRHQLKGPRILKSFAGKSFRATMSGGECAIRPIDEISWNRI